jgi:hypothetical protein
VREEAWRVVALEMNVRVGRMLEDAMHERLLKKTSV